MNETLALSVIVIIYLLTFVFACAYYFKYTALEKAARIALRHANKNSTEHQKREMYKELEQLRNSF